LSRWLTQLIFCVLSFVLGKQYAAMFNETASNDVISRHTSSDHVFLLVMVISAPNNLAKRMAVRNTWLLSSSSSDVRHYFVIGTGGSLPESVTSQLRKENAEYGDLVLLPVLVDEYRALTAKVLKGLVSLDDKWDFNYLLKADDDSFARVPAILDELKNSNYPDGLYWGYFDGRAPVQRRGQWAETDYVLCDRYLPYALGGGYVLSANLVTYLANNADELQVFASEDVSVGTWLAPLKNIHRVHDVRFDTQWASRGCSNTHIVMHKVSPADMKAKQNKLVASNYQEMCEEETVKRPAYEYNWNTLPSNCCKPVKPEQNDGSKRGRRQSGGT